MWFESIGLQILGKQAKEQSCRVFARGVRVSGWGLYLRTGQEAHAKQIGRKSLECVPVQSESPAEVLSYYMARERKVVSLWTFQRALARFLSAVSLFNSAWGKEDESERLILAKALHTPARNIPHLPWRESVEPEARCVS